MSGADRRLELRRKLCQRSVWPAAAAVAVGGSLPAPLVVELDPTTACDFACPECISGKLLNQGGFSSERLCALARELVDAGVRAVILIGGGEPLLHPAIAEVLTVLGDGGVAIGITTNGGQLDRLRAPVARHASWVRVSLDAGTAATHRRFRPHRARRDAFERVVAGMRRLAAVKNGALGYSFLLMFRQDRHGAVVAENYAEVLRAARLARDIGCDYFEVKPAYDQDHFLIRPPPALRRTLRRQLASLPELETARFRVVTPATLETVTGALPLVEPKTYRRCPVAELRTLITPDGAYICPYHRGRARRRYGRPATERFDRLWNGAERQAVMTSTQPSRDCRFHCIRHRSNLDLLAAGRQSAPAPALIDDFDPFL